VARVELDPNSSLHYLARPNSRIRDQIPELWIPGPIHIIQTQCKCTRISELLRLCLSKIFCCPTKRVPKPRHVWCASKR
jgi:hypothetical protein